MSGHIRNKIDVTMDERYGGYTFKSDALSKKAKATMRDRYGVETPMECDNFNTQRKNTNIKRYGYESPNQNEKVKGKKVSTNMQKYGVSNTFNLIQTKNTFLQRYNVINPSQIPDIQKKIRTTCKEKFGNEVFFSSKYAKDKIKQTFLDRYGVENPMQCPEIRNRALSTMLTKSYRIRQYTTKFNDIVTYQSKAELEFIVLCEFNNIKILDGPSISYIFKNKNKTYHSDFVIFENNAWRIVEIKRKHPWWFKDLKRGIIRAKVNSAIKFSRDKNYKPYKILFENKI